MKGGAEDCCINILPVSSIDAYKSGAFHQYNMNLKS